MLRVRVTVIGVLVVLVSIGICAAAGGDEASVQRSVVTIEAGKIGEPVSPYIYGQFIEHLGRCIYGGIWAEMLEDRKFYYPIPADGPIWKEHEGAGVLAGSPWEITGWPGQTVTMTKDKAYCGEHSARIQVAAKAPVGIHQRGLGLVKGKKYTGYIVLAADDADTECQINLIWGKGSSDGGQTVTLPRLSKDFKKYPFEFTCGGDTEDGWLRILVFGKGAEPAGAVTVGAVSLMPADNIKGMRADTIKLLKELNAPIYRWPGGNFVSGYDWRDGVGERDKRPPRKNPAWTGVEHNDFGLDEFIIFCREVGAEPLIVANSGFGDDHSAGEEVAYANGSADMPMGRWRAENGHPKPYNVKWWGIGNEMYGKWQLGHVSLEHYVQKHNLFARAMRKVDPSIKLVAVGDTGNWSRGMLSNCADYMDLISEHFYRGENKSVVDHVWQTVDAIRSKVEAHRSYREKIESLKGKDIRIALDEWNYWHRPYVYEYGELGCRYTLKDALGIATGLHEMIRSSDMIFMANYAQTVNVIGCIKTTKTEAAFATTGLALKLYRNHFGTIPVEVSGSFEPLDVVAAWTADRKALTIAVVNPTAESREVTIDMKDAGRTGSGKLWQIGGSDPNAYNEPGKAAKVVIEERLLTGSARELGAAPYSVSVYELAAK
ncbi:MAG TPA: alpha-L-arabinofuranosidase C-terminal domain-containing protein [Sedimentisphaerales bacterium]|nr:alpha-L-arabinofuranosidase C-terminal domain-containing protein [Sedimentisphaerales bacterium]